MRCSIQITFKKTGDAVGRKRAMRNHVSKYILVLCLSVSSLLIYASPTFAKTESIQLPVPGQGVKKGLLASPSGDEKYPAIVFMHGGAIRDKGVSTSSLNSRLSNFVSLGFIVLAPLRNTKKGCCNGDDAIMEGIATANQSSEYLASLPNVDKSRICLVGFSEGALISMWVMSEPNNFSSAVIMSPSNQCGMKRAGSKNYCGTKLIESGKVQKVTKNVIVTLGDKDRKPHQKTANGFSKLLGTKTEMMKGNHKSFLKPRKDINAVVLEHCLK